MRFLRLREVQQRTGRGRSSIYAEIKRGTFPAAVKIGERASAWLEHEIDAWIAARVAATRGDTSPSAAPADEVPQ